LYIQIQIQKVINAMKTSRSLEKPAGGWRETWRMICDFMTDKSIAANPPLCQYDRKARFYPYLPPREEQRDWLEKQYERSS
jgi:hypothetical protein